MKSLIKYTNKQEEVVLEDYFGKEHKGRIILEEKVVGKNGKGVHENRYFFVRGDGAKIRVYHKGFARVMESDKGSLSLKLRDVRGVYRGATDLSTSFKFENLRVT